MSASYLKALPVPDAVSSPFWNTLLAGVLSIQLCSSCGARQFYGRVCCATCGSLEVVWEAVSGRGTVYSFTVIRRTSAAGFKDDVPYVVALVQLEEGPRMLTNIVGCDPDAVAVEQPVVVRPTIVAEGVALPYFELVR